jgi:hypothetical protein
VVVLLRIIFIAALLFPTWTWANGSPASTYGQDKVYHSWQVDHPVLTGVLSGLTMGLWPSDFGDDRRGLAGGVAMNSGYGLNAYDYVKQHSQVIFDTARWMSLLLSLLFYLGLAWRIMRSRGKRRETI